MAPPPRKMEREDGGWLGPEGPGGSETEEVGDPRQALGRRWGGLSKFRNLLTTLFCPADLPSSASRWRAFASLLFFTKHCIRACRELSIQVRLAKTFSVRSPEAGVLRPWEDKLSVCFAEPASGAGSYAAAYFLAEPGSLTH